MKMSYIEFFFNMFLFSLPNKNPVGEWYYFYCIEFKIFWYKIILFHQIEIRGRLISFYLSYALPTRKWFITDFIYC